MMALLLELLLLILLLLLLLLKLAGLKRSGGVKGGLGGVPANDGVLVRKELEPGLCGDSLRGDSFPMSGSGVHRSFFTPVAVPLIAVAARFTFLRRAFVTGALQMVACRVDVSLSWWLPVVVIDVNNVRPCVYK